MDYDLLLDLATDIGYELAMAGAETFRVEDTPQHILTSYGVSGEVAAFPNHLVVSLTTGEGKSMTRMRRIGNHGNNLDGVEKLNALSRTICKTLPDPAQGQEMLRATLDSTLYYSFPIRVLGHFLGAGGFSMLFGCSPIDMVCAGLCGVIISFICRWMEKMKAIRFFTTIAASFLMAMTAYMLNIVGIVQNPDTVITGAMMVLVPGLIFTNAMRDIIYGDTNSGINRFVQVLLISAAMALGTAAGWNLICRYLGTPTNIPLHVYSTGVQCAAAFVGCIGFSILYDIHGPGGLLCAAGGILCWVLYLWIGRHGHSLLTAYFWASAFASLYAEVMARIRKYPAISYLVVSIFPLIPGAGVYYTMNHAVRGEMELFASQGLQTAEAAATMAVGILLVSSIVRLVLEWNRQRGQK